MDPPRAQLVRLLQRRRRRIRLLMVCVVTAVTCGAVAGVLEPRILIGGTAGGPLDRSAAMETPATVSTEPAPTPLDLEARLALDPREEQANALRWQEMSDRKHRRLLDRYWDLAALESDQRDALLEQYERFRKLPEARRRFLRERARKLKAFVASLSPQDQAVLEGMNDEARARRLLALWHARYGPW